MSAPQSAAYGRMPMATCYRKRQLFSCRLPSASERRNLWKNSARVLYSLFGNADCIPPSRGGAKTRSTSQRLRRRSVFRLTKGHAPLQCERIASGVRPRSPQAERSALPLQASKAFTSLQGDTIATSRHPEPAEGSLWKYRQNLNRDPSASLRFAQDDKKVAKLSFNDLIARGKMTLLPKRPQFAAYLRLSRKE